MKVILNYSLNEKSEVSEILSASKKLGAAYGWILTSFSDEELSKTVQNLLKSTDLDNGYPDEWVRVFGTGKFSRTYRCVCPVCLERNVERKLVNVFNYEEPIETLCRCCKNTITLKVEF